MWGLPSNFPRADPRLQRRGGAAHWGFAAEGLPEENPEGTVIPLYPKDYQQLLRLPKSWGLLANEARRLELLTEFMTKFFLLWSVILHNFLWKTLKFHKSQTVRVLDLIPTLRARPKHGLSSGWTPAALQFNGWTAAARSFNSRIELMCCAHRPMGGPQTDLTLYYSTVWGLTHPLG